MGALASTVASVLRKRGGPLLVGMNDGGDGYAKIDAMMGSAAPGQFYGRGGYDIWTTGFDPSTHAGWSTANPWFFDETNAATPPFKRTFAISTCLCAYDSSMTSAGGGTYDSIYTAMANAIIAGVNAAKAREPVLIRPAAELTGTWFPWSPGSGTPGATVTNFKLAWIRHVNCFRAAALAAGKPRNFFKFDWNIAIWNGSDTPANVALLYPGDDYVDFIGADFYIESAIFSGLSGTNANKAQQMMDSLVKGTDFNNVGLSWLESFAAARNKPVAFWEWCAGGVTQNGITGERTIGETFQTTFGPLMMQKVAEWMSRRNVAYEMYWNSDEGFYGAFNAITGDTHGTAAMAAIKTAYDTYFPLIRAGKF